MRGQVIQVVFLFKQILYMCINRQIDTTYFLYFLLHLCVPGLNSPLAMLQSATPGPCGGGDKVRPAWQVASGGGPGATGSAVKAGPLQRAPAARSALGPDPGACRPLGSYTLSIKRGDGRGRWAFVKAKDHRSFWRVGRWSRGVTAPAALCLPSLLLLPLPPPPLLLWRLQ
uniref:Uncharacterized protein n=1 Tax=Molossus molossus TaxID=27622 RepID=A0A7J8HZX6_MOLMO|nr:hypothetical protein HJG59_010763 [Molossus molossus]